MIIITTAYYNKIRLKELLKCLEINSNFLSDRKNNLFFRKSTK